MKLKYICPHCLVKSYSKHWNAETMKKYRTDSDGIYGIQLNEDYSSHICPDCKKESEMVKGDLICIETTK